MKRNIFLSLSFAAAGIALNCAPAVAQATRTYVSGVGDDANPFSRTAFSPAVPGWPWCS